MDGWMDGFSVFLRKSYLNETINPARDSCSSVSLHIKPHLAAPHSISWWNSGGSFASHLFNFRPCRFICFWWNILPSLCWSYHLLCFKTLKCLDGISKQSVKTSECRGQPGVQQNKNSGTRITSQTVNTTTNEGSKTMGRGFLNWPPTPTTHMSGSDAEGRKAEALFSRLFPVESTQCGCRHQGRLWGHYSPSGRGTSHTHGTIWLALLPPVPISR